MTFSVPCQHDGEKHTLMFMFRGDHDGIPHERTYDTRAEAVVAARVMSCMAKVDDDYGLAFVKVFRADNENYVCHSWVSNNIGTSPSSTAATRVIPRRSLRTRLQARFTWFGKPMRIDDW